MVNQKNNRILGEYELDAQSKITFLGVNGLLSFKSKPKYMRGFLLTIGNNAEVHIGANAYLRGKFHVGDGCKLFIGDNVKCSWAVLINAEEKTSITIGDDCLFSDISIYSSDSHSIFDLETRTRINPAADIVLGDRVWLGRRVIVTKGVNIGHDVAVGANSLVNRNLPSYSVCAGIPAKVLKRGVVWCQERTFDFPASRKATAMTYLNGARGLTTEDSSAVQLSQTDYQFFMKEQNMKPIEAITGEQAFKNLTRNAVYPSPKRGSERLHPLPCVEHHAKFVLTNTSKIFTIGSCFARNIERYLLGSGFNVVSNEFAQHIQGDASIQNKYNSASILQDLQIALEKPELINNIEESFYEEGGSFYSLHFGGSGAVEIRTKEQLKDLTKTYYDVMSKLKECDVLIVTLGLVEVWYDLVAKCFLIVAPPKSLVRQNPGRYELRVQSYHDILSDLNEIYELVKKHMHSEAQMLVTVSPVPLQATFRGQDVLQANVYSKAVQRAATEEFLKHKDQANYFPSYEIVALASMEKAWIASDYRHVHADMVAHIMANFLKSYVVNMTIIPHKDELQALHKNGNYEVIYTRLQALFSQNPTYWEQPRPQFLYVKYYFGLAAKQLIKRKSDSYYTDALAALNYVFSVNGRHYNSAIHAAKILIKYGEKQSAENILKIVIERDSNNQQALELLNHK